MLLESFAKLPKGHCQLRPRHDVGFWTGSSPAGLIRYGRTVPVREFTRNLRAEGLIRQPVIGSEVEYEAQTSLMRRRGLSLRPHQWVKKKGFAPDQQRRCRTEMPTGGPHVLMQNLDDKGSLSTQSRAVRKARTGQTPPAVRGSDLSVLPNLRFSKLVPKPKH